MTQEHYINGCIDRAVAYIAEALRDDRTPELAGIAAAAGLSKYHFHRLYALATGETCQETITRLRLARAADALKDPDMSITQAAHDAGYGSSQSFAKTLRRLLSTSASQLRADPEQLAKAVETLLEPLDGDGNTQAHLRVALASFDPFDIIVTQTEGRYPSLNTTYWALFEAAQDASLVDGILGFPHDSIAGPEAGDIRFDCALKMAQLPKDLPETVHQAQVSGGLFLQTRHIGSYEALPDAVDRLYLTVLANAGLKIADQPCVFHYLDDPEETDEADLRTDVYLPILSEGEV